MGHTITNTSIIGILLVLLILQVRTLQVEQSVNVRWSHGTSGHSTEAKPRLHDKDEVDGGIPAEEQLKKITSGAGSQLRQKRQMDKSKFKWKNRTMYYYYEDDFEENRRVMVEKAMSYIRARTCIDFVKNSTANHSIRFSKKGECSFYTKGISLGPSCDKKNYTHDFEPLRKEDFIKYVPYDYGSIMHYGPNDFQAISPSNESHVITPLKERYLWTIGSEIPSFYDIMMINKHYNCSENCRFSKRIKCANGGVPNPRKCDECLCPTATVANFVISGHIQPAGCGEILKAKSHWKTKTFGFDKPRTKLNDEQDYAMCNYWIVAPPGKFVQIRVTGLPDDCHYGCFSNAIEPKILNNRRMTNPRICCKNQLNETLTSKLNPTPIFSYAKGNPHFTFQYRYTNA